MIISRGHAILCGINAESWWWIIVGLVQ